MLMTKFHSFPSNESSRIFCNEAMRSTEVLNSFHRHKTAYVQFSISSSLQRSHRCIVISLFTNQLKKIAKNGFVQDKRGYLTSSVEESVKIDEISLICYNVDDDSPFTDATIDDKCSTNIWALKRKEKFWLRRFHCCFEQICAYYLLNINFDVCNKRITIVCWIAILYLVFFVLRIIKFIVPDELLIKLISWVFIKMTNLWICSLHSMIVYLPSMRFPNV